MKRAKPIVACASLHEAALERSMCKLGEKPLINAGGGKGCSPQTRMRGLRSAQACCGA